MFTNFTTLLDGHVQVSEMRFDLSESGERVPNEKGKHVRKLRTMLPTYLLPESLKLFGVGVSGTLDMLGELDAEMGFVLSLLLRDPLPMSSFKMSPETPTRAIFMRGNNRRVAEELQRIAEKSSVTPDDVKIEYQSGGVRNGEDTQSHVPVIPVMTVSPTEFMSLTRMCPNAYLVSQIPTFNDVFRVSDRMYVPISVEDNSVIIFRVIPEEIYAQIRYPKFLVAEAPVAEICGKRYSITNEAIRVVNLH